MKRHIPEITLLRDFPVKVGATVYRRQDVNANIPLSVVGIEGCTAAVTIPAGETQPAVVADLLVLRRFGDPIYPALTPIGTVERDEDRRYHGVIERENCRALRLTGIWRALPTSSQATRDSPPVGIPKLRPRQLASKAAPRPHNALTAGSSPRIPEPSHSSHTAKSRTMSACAWSRSPRSSAPRCSDAASITSLLVRRVTSRRCPPPAIPSGPAAERAPRHQPIRAAQLGISLMRRAAT